MVKTIDNPWNQPDVSKVTPVYVPKNGTRSYKMDIVFIKNGQYRTVCGYWDDIDKCWRYASSGEKISYEIVRTKPNPDTIRYLD